MARARGALLAAAVSLLAAGFLIGCGGDEGAAAGATVRVYVGAGLCPEAEQALAAAGGKAGDLRVQAVCLPPVEGAALGSRRVKLAVVGANARRATEDSSAIAYLDPPGPANRFAEPIIEESGVAFVKASSGGKAMRQVLSAIEEGDSASARDRVRSALESE